VIRYSDIDINRAHPTSDMTVNKRDFGDVGDKNVGSECKQDLQWHLNRCSRPNLGVLDPSILA